jgi:hypothetical protein
MFNLKLIKKMETKQMNVEFLDTDNLKESCLINGSPLLSEDLMPEEEYYMKVYDFCESFKVVNISKIADAIQKMELEGMDLAMWAFTTGHIAAQNSNDLCMRMISIVKDWADGRCTKACIASQKAASTVFDAEKAAIVSVIHFGIMCYVAGNVQEIMMKAMMENASGGLLGKMGGR